MVIKIAPTFTKESTDQTIDISSIFVPYKPSDQAASKWAILGAYDQGLLEKFRKSVQSISEESGKMISEKLLIDFVEQYSDPDAAHNQIYIITTSDKPEALQDLVAFNDDIENEEQALEWLHAKGFALDVLEEGKQKDALPEEKEPPQTPPEDGDEGQAGALIQEEEYFEVPPWEDEFWQDEKSVVTLMRSALIQKHKERNEALIGTGQQAMSMSVPAVHAVMTENYMNMGLTVVNTAILIVLAGAYRSNERAYDSLLRVHSQLAHDRKNPDVDKDMMISRVVEGLQRLGISISSTKVVDPQEYRRLLPEIRDIEVRRNYRINERITEQDAINAGESIATISEAQSASWAKKLTEEIKYAALFVKEIFKETGKDIRNLPQTSKGFVDGFKAATLKSKYEKEVIQKDTADIVARVDKKLEVIIASEDVPEAEIMHTRRSREQIESTRQLLSELKNYESIWPAANFAMASTANMISLGSLVSSALSINILGIAVNTWDLFAGGIGSNAKTGSIYYAHARERNSFIAQAARNQIDLVDSNDRLRARALEIEQQQVAPEA